MTVFLDFLCIQSAFSHWRAQHSLDWQTSNACLEELSLIWHSFGCEVNSAGVLIQEQLKSVRRFLNVQTEVQMQLNYPRWTAGPGRAGTLWPSAVTWLFVLRSTAKVVEAASQGDKLGQEMVDKQIDGILRYRDLVELSFASRYYWSKLNLLYNMKENFMLEIHTISDHL